MNISRTLLARSTFGVLIAASLAACSTTVAGTALPDPKALAAAVTQDLPTDIGELPTDIPTDPGQIPTEEGDNTDEPGTGDSPQEPQEPQQPESTDIPDIPTDAEGLPDFGQLPADWPADIVLPPGAEITFGYSDPASGSSVLFSAPDSNVTELGEYFTSTLPTAGYEAGQTGEFSGVYSGMFTKGNVQVSVGIIDVGGELAGTITVTTS